jgi:dUTPase
MTEIKNKTSHEQFMYLSIFVDDDDEELKKLYIDAAEKHNNNLLEDPHFYDAGFDLFLPKNIKHHSNMDYGTKFFGNYLPEYIKDNRQIPINKVDFRVKCSAKIYNNHRTYFTPFYTYARSSISKTPLRLANNQGIIDAGYRGNLIGMFDCIVNSDRDDDDFVWHMEKYSRMIQICAPGLIPIYVTIVDKFEELGPSTSRGDGGFGSTGK